MARWIVIILPEQLHCPWNKIVLKKAKLKLMKGVGGHDLVGVEFWPQTFHEGNLGMLLLRRFRG
jgi:hypothetical protein